MLTKKQKYDKKYREKNKEKRRRQNKAWFESVRKIKFTENPQHYLWYIARTRARKNNMDFLISEEDIIIPELCPILGTKLTKGNGYLPNSMSLDRVDNTKGYIPGNVRVISRKANLLKSCLTLAMLEKLVKYVKGEI